jgi:tRNA dimethylallyltransferase
LAESCDKNQKHPVLAVVGPTATGKTALGVALAEAFEGEVISADSMQIYKGLDVGTAKVAPDEIHGIPHHAVDILEPDEPFSVADFVTLAGKLEADISARGRLPILVGGTGLYVQSFLYGVRFAAEKTPDGLREQLAAELAEKGPEAMYKELQAADPEAAAAIHPNNQVRVLRALEHFRATGKRLSEQKAQSLPLERPYRSLVLGLDFPGRAQLYHRIDRRVDTSASSMRQSGSMTTARPTARQRRPSATRSSSPILRGRPRWMPAPKSSSRPPATTPSAS